MINVGNRNKILVEDVNLTINYIGIRNTSSWESGLVMVDTKWIVFNVWLMFLEVAKGTDSWQRQQLFLF
jgi:hypothetical protein